MVPKQRADRDLSVRLHTPMCRRRLTQDSAEDDDIMEVDMTNDEDQQLASRPRQKRQPAAKRGPKLQGSEDKDGGAGAGAGEGDGEEDDEVVLVSSGSDGEGGSAGAPKRPAAKAAPPVRLCCWAAAWAAHQLASCRSVISRA